MTLYTYTDASRQHMWWLTIVHITSHTYRYVVGVHSCETNIQEYSYILFDIKNTHVRGRRQQELARWAEGATHSTLATPSSLSPTICKMDLMLGNDISISSGKVKCKPKGFCNSKTVKNIFHDIVPYIDVKKHFAKILGLYRKSRSKNICTKRWIFFAQECT